MATKPRVYTFTYRDVWNKAVEIVRYHPNGLNWTGKTEGNPVYFSDGCPSCLFGHVLKGLGVHVDDIEEGSPIYIVLERLIGPMDYDDKPGRNLVNAISHLQAEADGTRAYWAGALRATRDTYGIS